MRMMERDVSFLGENVVMYECVFGVAILIKVNTVRRTSLGHKVTNDLGHFHPISIL